MALLLNIDTATELASVCVSLNGVPLAFKASQHQREHASFVHSAVESLLLEAGIKLEDLEAFSVTAGPGSYTGLRVGLATAKGFSYAFSKPLITVNTLEVMAQAALETIGGIDKKRLLCPMIDARRMEVFAALYDAELVNVLSPQPITLDEKSFNNYMTKGEIVFFGSGSIKFKALNKSQNAVFSRMGHSARNLASLADRAFKQKKFVDVTYSEPQYFKDFHSFSTV